MRLAVASAQIGIKVERIPEDAEHFTEVCGDRYAPSVKQGGILVLTDCKM